MCQLLSTSANQQAGAGIHSTDIPVPEALELFQEVDQTPAFAETLNYKRFVRSAPSNDTEQFLLEMVTPIEQYITSALHRFRSIRVGVFVHPTYVEIANTRPVAIPPFSPVLRRKLVAVLRTHSFRK